MAGPEQTPVEKWFAVCTRLLMDGKINTPEYLEAQGQLRTAFAEERARDEADFEIQVAARFERVRSRLVKEIEPEHAPLLPPAPKSVSVVREPTPAETAKVALFRSYQDERDRWSRENRAGRVAPYPGWDPGPDSIPLWRDGKKPHIHRSQIEDGYFD